MSRCPRCNAQAARLPRRVIAARCTMSPSPLGRRLWAYRCRLLLVQTLEAIACRRPTRPVVAALKPPAFGVAHHKFAVAESDQIGHCAGALARLYLALEFVDFLPGLPSITRPLEYVVVQAAAERVPSHYAQDGSAAGLSKPRLTAIRRAEPATVVGPPVARLPSCRNDQLRGEEVAADRAIRFRKLQWRALSPVQPAVE